MECLEKDLEERVTYLLFPTDHHKRIRTTNRLERLQGEGQRRSKVIPRFSSEASCLTLMCATLITVSRQGRGVQNDDLHSQAAQPTPCRTNAEYIERDRAMVEREQRLQNFYKNNFT
jgi:transposase-like protein